MTLLKGNKVKLATNNWGVQLAEPIIQARFIVSAITKLAIEFRKLFLVVVSTFLLVTYGYSFIAI